MSQCISIEERLQNLEKSKNEINDTITSLSSRLNKRAGVSMIYVSDKDVEDANNYLDTAYYIINANKAVSNFPVTPATGVLEVKGNDGVSSATIQIFTAISGTRYSRMKWWGSWSSWKS